MTEMGQVTRLLSEIMYSYNYKVTTTTPLFKGWTEGANTPAGVRKVLHTHGLGLPLLVINAQNLGETDQYSKLLNVTRRIGAVFVIVQERRNMVFVGSTSKLFQTLVSLIFETSTLPVSSTLSSEVKLFGLTDVYIAIFAAKVRSKRYLIKVTKKVELLEDMKDSEIIHYLH